ncbi:hypothetical protein SLEP1_g11788 [Rubroshorea leprosula]|nr:hypothetical protein SLEP1_g11788 [Rubroshorea leprosula]
MGEECEIVVREFDPSKDLSSVEDVERRCEVGSGGKLSLFTDLLGDPICRVRHSPSFLMLGSSGGQMVPKGGQNGQFDKMDEVIISNLVLC